MTLSLATRAVSTAALGAALLAGCASPSADTSGSTTARHPVRGRLVAIARRMASGKPIVLAQAVRSTHAHANRVWSGDGVSGQEAVWLIQVRVARTIVCGYCSAPSNASLPRGRIVTEIVTARSLTLTDSGIGNKPTDLHRLGHVITLIR